MRVVGEITNDECKITIFNWNNRYIIKLEQGPLEETFKVNEYDISTEAALNKIIDSQFITEALERFKSMNISLSEAVSRG